MARGHKLQNFLLCDMIITDIQNKNTLVGVYGHDIIVPQFPARLRLALYGEFLPETAGDYEIELTLRSDKRPIAKAIVALEQTVPKKILPLTLPPFELLFTNSEAFSITAIVNKRGKPQQVLRREIIQGPLPPGPIVLQPPSAQSPDAAQDSAEKPD